MLTNQGQVRGSTLRKFKTLLRGAEKEENVEFEDVLKDKLGEPFSLENFHIFLKSRMAEENLEFYLSVENLKHSMEKDSSEEVVILSLHEEILQKFVEVDSETQVNLSGKTRKETLQRVKSSISKKKVKHGVFDDAVKEIKGLMEADIFFSFLKVARTQNLSKSVAFRRKVLGVFTLLIGVGIVAAFVLLSAETKVHILESPFWRLVSILFFIPGWFYFLSGSYKMCPILNHSNKYATCNGHTEDDVLKGIAQCPLTHNVCDKRVKKGFRKLGRKIITKIFVYSIVLGVIAVLLPPNSFFENEEF